MKPTLVYRKPKGRKLAESFRGSDIATDSAKIAVRPAKAALEPRQGGKAGKKMDPQSDAYERAANRLARSFAPQIEPCRECGHPVVDGYCCNTCGSSTP